jgi:TatD DNase family protein
LAGRAADAAALTEAAIDRTRAVAVGEIGLDYHYDHAPRDVQREVFAAQVAVAVRRRLPVVIHTREADADTVAVLESYCGRVSGIMHTFSGDRAMAARLVDIGWYISISGMVTFPKSEETREVARAVPADRLLVETDSPFLAPIPHRGKRNEPAFVRHTAEAVAGLRGMTLDELAALTTRGAKTRRAGSASGRRRSTPSRPNS